MIHRLALLMGGTGAAGVLALALALGGFGAPLSNTADGFVPVANDALGGGQLAADAPTDQPTMTTSLGGGGPHETPKKVIDTVYVLPPPREFTRASRRATPIGRPTPPASRATTTTAATRPATTRTATSKAMTRAPTTRTKTPMRTPKTARTTRPAVRTTTTMAIIPTTVAPMTAARNRVATNDRPASAASTALADGRTGAAAETRRGVGGGSRPGPQGFAAAPRGSAADRHRAPPSSRSTSQY